MLAPFALLTAFTGNAITPPAVPVGLWLVLGGLVSGVLVLVALLQRARRRAAALQQQLASVLAQPAPVVAPTEPVQADPLRHDLVRQVLERAPLGVVLVSGIEQQLRFVNDRAAALLGASPTELHGRCLPEVTAADAVHDENGLPVPSADWPLSRALLHQQTTVQQNLRLSRGGRDYWLKCSATPLNGTDGEAPSAVLLVQDVTRERDLAQLFQRLNDELHRKSQSLERAERLLTGALAQAPMIVLIINVPELSIRLLNDYGKRYFGLGEAEYEARLRGQVLLDLGECPIRNGEGLKLEWEVLPPVRAGLEGEVIEAQDLLFHAADGTDHRLSCSAAPIRDERGEIVAAIALAIDITTQRQAEEQRRALLARVKDSERLEALGVLAGSIAHDFNNLLATIVGHNDMAQSLLDPEHPIQPDLTAIATSSERAAEIVKRMLALSGSNVSMRAPVDLAMLVREEIQAQRPALPNGVHLIVDLAPGLPQFYGDRSALRQLIASLLGSALEVLVDMSGEVLVALHQRHLDNAPAGILIEGEFKPGVYLDFTVADDGAGMAAESLAQVFEPFGSARFQGRGLGLAAVRGTVRAHRGLLCVHTAPNQGLRATVLLPVGRNGG